jgi:beta-galactosidase GanA
MYYGVQYYPEQWPEERWPVDAEMMQRAGVNTVRMGEFAWSAYEPHEGELNFDWMDRAVKLLNNHGIQVIMCTCSRTPPPWVFKKYPGILNVLPDGRTNNYGMRYTIGLTHPEFIQIAERIDRAVIEHFANHPGIIAWQIDNEVGGGNDCYCPRCLATFQDYLRDKYGTVEKLNQSWGEHFWSFHFSDFSEVPLPANNPQLSLEYRRFLSHLNVEFSRSRSEMIHKIDPGKFVTTNFQSFVMKHTDYFQTARVIDLPGMNHYPPRSPEFLLDYYRGEKGSVLVLEQLSRLMEWDTGEGWMRLWAYRASVPSSGAASAACPPIQVASCAAARKKNSPPSPTSTPPASRRGTAPSSAARPAAQSSPRTRRKTVQPLNPASARYAAMCGTRGLAPVEAVKPAVDASVKPAADAAKKATA